MYHSLVDFGSIYCNFALLRRILDTLNFHIFPKFAALFDALFAVSFSELQSIKVQ